MPMPVSLSRQYNPPSTLQLVRNHTDTQTHCQGQGEGAGGKGSPDFPLWHHVGTRQEPAQPMFWGCTWPADAAQSGWVPPGDIPVMAEVIFFGVCSSKCVK